MHGERVCYTPGMSLRERVGLLVGAGWEVRGLASWCGVSHPTVHRLLRGEPIRPESEARIIAGLRRLGEIASPQGSEEHAGLAEVAADHRLLTALGVTELELSRARALLGTRDAALLVLAAIRVGREPPPP